MVEDYAYSWATYSWERQSSVPVQFTVLVMGSYYSHPSCKFFHLAPFFSIVLTSDDGMAQTEKEITLSGNLVD